MNQHEPLMMAKILWESAFRSGIQLIVNSLPHITKYFGIFHSEAHNMSNQFISRVL